MATQLQFYQNAVPLAASRHADWSVEPRDFSFSRTSSSVPLMAVEFPVAAEEYAIVFVGQPGEVVPVAITGVRPNENLFVDAAGGWDAKYIPGFVRRYPFVFTTPDGGDTLTLCIDEAYPGINQEGRGQRLFDEERKPSQFTGQVMEFLRDYQVEFGRTQTFCRKLEEMKLLEPMQVEVGTPGASSSLGGFLGVDREKMRALSGKRLAELAKDDSLEMIYVHLQSMRNFGRMRGRLEARQGAAKA
ncbi:SapC family protein [Ramlibacter sp. XY19]|uniref:SapC family protein n=1 Tax=Ramlibacter paludis TaxID=2908000 RepID=UPI0023DB40AC|nr:SapC family protein [Ramlibacter paludis]MCG2593202.1 SapC family protein [Ramlibacter paludis]